MSVAPPVISVIKYKWGQLLWRNSQPLVREAAVCLANSPLATSAYRRLW